MPTRPWGNRPTLAVKGGDYRKDGHSLGTGPRVLHLTGKPSMAELHPPPLPPFTSGLPVQPKQTWIWYPPALFDLQACTSRSGLQGSFNPTWPHVPTRGRAQLHVPRTQDTYSKSKEESRAGSHTGKAAMSRIKTETTRGRVWLSELGQPGTF